MGKRVFLLIMKIKQSHYIILVSLLIFNFSCDFRNDNRMSLSEIRNIDFDLGYSPLTRYSGTIEISNREYLYFADVMTNKCIDIVNVNGDSLCKIPLNKITDTKEYIEDFYIKNLDSIFILTQYTNHLYLIDKKGIIHNCINLNKYIEHIGKFEMSSSAYQDFYFNNSFLFHGYRTATLESSGFKDKVKALKYWYGKYYASPYFFRFNNVFTDSADLQTGLDGYYSKLVKSDSFLVESTYYYHTKDKLFCFSSYSNEISEISPGSLKIDKTITVKSGFTKIACSPVQINEKTVGNPSEFINNNLQTQGAICRLFFDKYRNLYYVVVWHSVNEKAPQNKRGANRSWSFFVYDTTFTKFSEIKMPSLKYEPDDMIVCKEGILISTNNQMNNTYERNKAKFTLFKISQ